MFELSILTPPVAFKIKFVAASVLLIVLVPAASVKTPVPEPSDKAPEEVPHVEAAPAVNVSAPAEVNCDAAVGVRLTAPAPVALKFPEVRVKRIGVVLAVVMLFPALYASCSGVVPPVVSQSDHEPLM